MPFSRVASETSSASWVGCQPIHAPVLQRGCALRCCRRLWLHPKDDLAGSNGVGQCERVTCAATVDTQCLRSKRCSCCSTLRRPTFKRSLCHSAGFPALHLARGGAGYRAVCLGRGVGSHSHTLRKWRQRRCPHRQLRIRSHGAVCTALHLVQDAGVRGTAPLPGNAAALALSSEVATMEAPTPPGTQPQPRQRPPGPSPLVKLMSQGHRATSHMAAA